MNLGHIILFKAHYFALKMKQDENFKMGLGWTHNSKFKMKSTYTNQKKNNNYCKLKIKLHKYEPTS